MCIRDRHGGIRHRAGCVGAMESIIVALITGVLSLVGVVITNTAAARRTENKITTAQAEMCIRDRGVGVVERLIPNQIEVNRTLARRAICVKR